MTSQFFSGPRGATRRSARTRTSEQEAHEGRATEDPAGGCGEQPDALAFDLEQPGPACSQPPRVEAKSPAVRVRLEASLLTSGEYLRPAQHTGHDLRQLLTWLSSPCRRGSKRSRPSWTSDRPIQVWGQAAQAARMRTQPPPSSSD